MRRPTTVTVDLVADEHTWQIAPGRAVSGYAFNSQVPGPTITAVAGDTLEVRLANRLPEPTTIHWHGLRVPAAMDGTEAVQRPVPPGCSFTYRFLLPDAGTFWYHPHTNETEQLEKGLYGALIVREPDEIPLDGEQVLLLDDLKLDRGDRLARFGGRRERHDGRIGATLLVNGQIEPALAIPAGQIQRWRVLNAASSRYVLLSIGDRPFTLLGTGGGLIEAPVTVTELLLPPACRAELRVGPYAAGDRFHIDALPYSRGMVKEAGGRFAAVEVSTGQPTKARIPSTLRRIAPLVDRHTESNRTVHLGGRMSLLRESTGSSTVMPTTTRIPSTSASCRYGTSSTTPEWTTHSTCTASSSRPWRSTANRRPSPHGTTPSTCQPKAECGSPGCRTTGPGAGCTTATSWSTTPRE